MHRANVYLDAEQLRALKQLATDDQSTVSEQIRRAVDSYVADRLAGNENWREPLDQFLARVRSRLPAGVGPEEVEADITAARHDPQVLSRGQGRR